MAKGSSIIDVDEIVRKLDKAIQQVGEEVGYEIMVAYRTAVEGFYAEYSPSSYDRTYSTYLASSWEGGGRPFYKKTGDMSCEAGITVDSSFMGEPYSKNHGWDPSASFIFERTFFEGIHGFHRGDVRNHNEELSKKGADYRWVPGSHPFKEFGYDNSDLYKANLLNGLVPNGARSNGSTIPRKGKKPVVDMNKRYKAIKKTISSKIDSVLDL